MIFRTVYLDDEKCMDKFKNNDKKNVDNKKKLSTFCQKFKSSVIELLNRLVPLESDLAF